MTSLCASCGVDIYLYVDSLLRSEYMLRFQDYVLGFCFKTGGSWWVVGNVLNLLALYLCTSSFIKYFSTERSCYSYPS